MSDYEYIDGESHEDRGEDLNIKSIVLQQVQKILRLGSVDMTRPRKVIMVNGQLQTTEDIADPKLEYSNAVRQLRFLLKGSLDEEANKELAKIDKEIKETKRLDNEFFWFNYKKQCLVFSIICEFLCRHDWMGSTELTK